MSSSTEREDQLRVPVGSVGKRARVDRQEVHLLPVEVAAANNLRRLCDGVREPSGRFLVVVDDSVHVAPDEEEGLGHDGLLER